MSMKMYIKGMKYQSFIIKPCLRTVQGSKRVAIMLVVIPLLLLGTICLMSATLNANKQVSNL